MGAEEAEGLRWSHDAEENGHWTPTMEGQTCYYFSLLLPDLGSFFVPHEPLRKTGLQKCDNYFQDQAFLTASFFFLTK